MLAAHVTGLPIIYPTIQSAVDAAPVGGTIQVDAGTYDELVTVNKSLTLRGASGGLSIVDGRPIGSARSSAFVITANDVTIDGFTVQGQSSSVDGAGIVIAPSMAGAHIVNNVIQQNAVGLYLANSSNSDAAIIRHNVFAYNNNVGANYGRGIYTDGGVSGGSLTNVLIDGNLFIGNVGNTSAGNAEAAIGLEAQLAPQSNIQITNNVMVGNGKGVLMSSLSGAFISGNYIAGSVDINSAAIRAEGGVNDVSIVGNTIVSNPAAAVRIDSKINGLPNSGFVMTGNNIAGNPAGGLVVAPGDYSGILDARKNFWGSPSGPSGIGPGTGDAIVATDVTVLFNPWSAGPADGQPKNLPVLQNTPLIDKDGDLKVQQKRQPATLPAGTYVVDDLTLSGGTTLTVTGPVTIYVTGKLDISGGSQLLTASGLAADLNIHLIGKANVTLSGKSILYAQLDASLGKVTLTGGSTLFGSLLDQKLDVNGGSTFIPSP